MILTHRTRLAVPLCIVLATIILIQPAEALAQLRAGAAAVDVTPTTFPVIINGSFVERQADRAHDRLMARAIVLDDGKTQIAIVVVDNLMMPRRLLDSVKQMASQATGIPTSHMLISATHAHSAPSVMACLGSRSDPTYEPFLPVQIAKSIEQAAARLVPARVGWAVIRDERHNHCRRWVFRPDRMASDPFGEKTVRAHMHPGYQSPNHIGPAGPADTDLSLLAIQTREGKPIAVLANYAMHYYGAAAVSADFCGRFGERLAELIGAQNSDPPFVGIMSKGTSGDSMWMDYSRPAPRRNIDQYTLEVAEVAKKAYQSIRYRHDISLAMAETTLKLRRRVPDAERLAWARKIVKELGDRLPRSQPEIYAWEQIYLHETPEVELKLQAVRIGQLGITAIPNEVYGITGLKLKAQSPLQPTFNIELANGAQGYIPPPEQHDLGGYTTWPARTAGLEVQAEPKIVATLLALLEKVSGKPRRPVSAPPTKYARAVAASKPAAFWRFQEMSGRRAKDETGQHHGSFTPGVAFYLPAQLAVGANQPGDSTPVARAVHFAGGWMKAEGVELGDAYTVEFWFWNGLPADARAVTAYLFSLGREGDSQAAGDHLGIGGTHGDGKNAGKLIVFNGNQKNQLLVGRTVIPLKSWNHVALVRKGKRVTVYLNGAATPEIDGELDVTRVADGETVFVGSRCDGFASLAGMITEVSLYRRPLPATEIAGHVTVVRPAPRPEPPPSSPADSLSAVHVRDGYTAELVAAEPLTIDPVAIAWGADGKLWVAEMADYPNGMDDQGKPGGRIRFLEDTDRDGRYDRSTVFLKDIPFPTGVLPWRSGVLVTAAPELFFAEDTDGDGKADRREVLFRGFLEGNQQLRVNGLRWGLDGWVYCANGAHHPGYGADRRIEAVKTGATVALGSRDFRFRPDTGEIDPLSGPSQFGRNRDDWGNWFGEQNSHPLWHYVLEDRYVRRNPHFASPDPRKQVVVPANPRVYPAKSPQKRFHSFEQSGRFTSACSGIIYRDRLLFADGMHTFACEPFHNVVQHNIVERDGVSFRARRDPAEGAIDFFASRDRWCRPVMVRTGPGGALWVVDMYRYMIEHPQWLTPEGREELRPFYRSGDDRGRIYRVYPEGKRPAAMPDLTQLPTASLVEQLASSSGTLRDLVSQVLVWRGDRAAIEPLKQMAAGHSRPLARLHALCVLDLLDALPVELITAAMGDTHPGIRRWAIRLAEPRGSRHPELVAAAARLADDPDAQVRLQLACTLGQWNDPAAFRALAQIAMRDGDDRYLGAAVMSSIRKENVSDVLEALVRSVGESDQRTGVPNPLVGRLLAMAIAFGNRQATVKGVEAILELPASQYRAWQFATIAGLLDAMARRKHTLATFFNSRDADQRRSLEQLRSLMERAADVAQDEGAALPDRLAAVRLLGRSRIRRSEEIERLVELLSPQSPLELQQAAVRQLATLPGDGVAHALLRDWPAHSPGLRREILAVLTTRKSWLLALLDSIEQGHVTPADIDARTRELLEVYRDAGIRERVAKLLASSGNDDRRRVVQEYQTVLKLTGSAERGAAVFEKQCASCHRLGGKGYEIGPNLQALTDRRPATLLTAILDPSASVEGKYVTYVALTADGLTFSGVLGTETGNSITLIEQDNKRHVILRSQLEAIRSTGKSLMPDGLEKEMTRQDIADVIAYVRSQANGK